MEIKKIGADIKCVAHGISPEKDPRERNKAKGDDDLRELICSWEPGYPRSDHGKYGIETMQGTPYYVCPVCAVPEATDQENDKNVSIPLPLFHAVPSQRDVQVIFKPR
jgi:hypothetical protein